MPQGFVGGWAGHWESLNTRVLHKDGHKGWGSTRAAVLIKPRQPRGPREGLISFRLRCLRTPPPGQGPQRESRGQFPADAEQK